MRKVILSILGVLLIVGGFFAAKALMNNKKNARPQKQKIVKTVFTEKVKNGIVPIVLKANGNLRAKQRMELYAEVQGVFKRGNKLFRPGQSYSSGETIINIDASEYRASVQSAKSNLYNQLTSVMPDIRLDYPDIFSKWQSYLTAFDLDKITPVLPKMTSEKEKFFISGRGILTSYYNIKNLEQRLSKYRMLAPFNGVLTEALVTEGTLIRGGQKLGEFIKTDVYELEVAIPKTYSDLLMKGKKVTLTNLDNTITYSGAVSRINGSVNQSSQTIKVFIEVKDKGLKEGMYLEAHLNARAENQAIEVNRNILLENNQMFVVKDSILDLIDVNPVYFSEKKAVVKGIPDGTVIMSKPLIGAFTGMEVNVFNDEKAKTGKTE